ncbi:MAG: DEAD/DEAH box helicase [Candidatus Didemnitutus sp.]|nr:DEAD/DEAH box helicase [Candidatus Didemnitutus sp.]
MLRILLPPNLATAAPRDAIAVRLELDLTAPPPANLLPGLAILQRFGVSPQPITLLQLKRAQLRELVSGLIGERVFFRVDRPGDPLPWNGIDLPGVTEHLAEKAPPPAPPPPPPKAAPKKKAEPGPSLTPLTVDGSEHFLAITLPSRESALYDAALELLRFHRFVLDPLTRKWWLRDRHKVLNLLATFGSELRERFNAEFTPNFESNTASLKFAEIAAEVREEKEGYDVSLGLKAGKASETQIRAALATGRGYIEDGKAIYLIDATRLAKLEAAHRALAQEPSATGAVGRHRVPKARAAEVSDLLAEVAPHFEAPETWRRRSAALRNLSILQRAPIPEWFTGTLRPYQELGVAWLWHLYQQDLGGILADEMGLGKTPQALALLAAATTARTRPTDARPHLVVVPASLMENWRRECVRFAPKLRVFIHHGGQRLAEKHFAAFDLVLTSYGTLARDTALFESVEFDLILADEAQHLKNRRTQAAQSLRALHGRGRFLLTGTPLENSLDDLRSLFEFLMPGFLPKLPAGLKREERSFHDDRLRAQTAPYILRRTKTAVAPELPEKIEQVIWCEPTAAQAALYRRLQEESERELFDLAAKGVSENQLRLATLTQLLRLRQVCCDPRLIKQAKPTDDSAKLEAWRELLAESIDEGHRMLVFSQFTSLLALLRAELDAQEVSYCYLDGSMSPKARQAEVDRFQSNDSTVPVFLISLKAGGTGLNLTAADVVVHYDPWWNPAAEAQATDRTHRIGQTKVVTSYRLICSGTVEEKVMALQDAKRALLADVFEASDAAAGRLNLADLRDLLK